MSNKKQDQKSSEIELNALKNGIKYIDQNKMDFHHSNLLTSKHAIISLNKIL